VGGAAGPRLTALRHPGGSRPTRFAAAGLVRVDALLLATLAADTFGRSPEAYLAAFGGGGCGTRASAAAAPAHPSRLRLAWRALREALFELERPTGGGPGGKAGRRWSLCSQA
jgi:hypothetical protein